METGAREWLLPAFRGLGGALFGAEATLMLGVGASLGSTWLLGQAIDGTLPLGPAALAYLAAVGLSAGCTWFARVRIEEVAQQAMLRVKERLFAHVMDHDVALHDEQGAGRLISRVTGDVEAMRALLSEAVLQAPADLALALGLLLILGWVAPSMALVAIASLPAYILLLIVYRRAAPQRLVAAREIAARVSGFYAEHVRALPLLRAFGRLPWLEARSAALSAEKARIDVAAGMTGVHLFNALFAVRSLTLAGMVWVGASQVHQGLLSIGTLLVALDYARKLFEPFIRLQFNLATFERARAGAVRVSELFARPRKVRAPADPQPWPGFQELVLQDIEFAYVEAVPVLRRVSLRLEPGRRVALVGPTGGGKSTIVQLLLRFIDPDQGRVQINGLDLRRLDPEVLRRHIGLVSQGVHLLPGTVAENIGARSDGDALRLLAEVGLAGVLAPGDAIGEGNRVLSRGEAQLVCVARALAGDPELLVLDEATAAMDPDTEARVSELTRRRSVLAIAHRLRLVADYDEIHVVAAGQIVESGDHASLLARGGVYAGLWQAQLASGA